MLGLVISRKFLRLIVSKLLFFSLSAISCHRCENSSSLDECQENQDDVDCPIPVHYCAKIKYESTTEGKIQTTYRKGCVTKDQCTANATSGNIVDCCKGDKCNKSKKKLFFILRNSILFNLIPRDVSFSKWRQHIRKREDPWTRFESCLKRGSLAVSSVVRMFKTSFLREKSH